MIGPAQSITIAFDGFTDTDVTAQVVQTEGITWQWGRQDWADDAPRPGVLTFVLDNSDGRFTPGNAAVYGGTGLAEGLYVVWTCGTRRITLRTLTPAMEYPTAMAGASWVRVQCVDAVGQLARRTLRSMLDEEILLSRPRGYWRMDEFGQGLDVRPADTSGRAAPSFVPIGDPEAFGWSEGLGPTMDSGGALHMLGSAEKAPMVGPALYTERPLRADAGWVLPPTTAPIAFVLSMWLTVKDIYPNPTTAGAWDAVHLATVSTGQGNASFGLFLRLADRTLMCADSANVGTYRALMRVPVSMTDTHHVSVRVETWDTQTRWAVRLDGGAESVVSTTRGADYPAPLGFGLRFGAPDRQTWDWPTSFGAGALLYSHAGTVARVAIFGGLNMGSASSRADPAGQLWSVGQLGAPERPADRAARIAQYVDFMSVNPQGVDRGDIVGRQDTAGRSALDAMCDALRSEDAALLWSAVGSLDLWLYSTQRPEASSLTVDVQDDCMGAPAVSFDTSQVASIVTVSSPSTFRRWRRPNAIIRSNASVDISSAQVSPGDALALAQYRASLGRITRPVPATVTVDLATGGAPVADVLNLRPGARVRTTGWRAAVQGYSQIDSYVTGADERYDLTGATVDLYLMPVGQDETRWQIYDGTTVADRGRLATNPTDMLYAFCADTDTTIRVDPRGGLAGSAIVQVIQIDDEQMRITGRTGSGLNVVRGINGTTATSHLNLTRIFSPLTGTIAY